MGKFDKLFSKWQKNYPKTARSHDVIGLIEHCGLEYRYGSKKSHIVIDDDLLDDFGIMCNYPDIFNGTMTLVVHHNEVKGFYIKRLVQFIAFKKEMSSDGQHE